MGEKSARNLIDAIEKSKERDFVNVLYALGIPNVGINASNLLVNEFKNIDNLMNADMERLTSIPGIGEVVAEGIINYFKSPKNRRLIENLKRAGLKFETEKVVSEGPLKNKTFVFTGELSSMTREEAQAIVRQLGGHPSSSISKKTDFVVAGNEPGSKYEKAKKLGIRIIDEQEFLKMIKTFKK